MPSLRVNLSNTEQSLIFPIFKKLTTIGNDIDNDIYIPDITLSPLHANIMFDGRNYYIHSANKSQIYFNKKKTKKHKFSECDKFSMGATSFEFILNDEELVEDSDKTVVDQNIYKKLLELSDSILEVNEFDNLLEKLLDMIISLVNAEKGYILIFKGKDIVAASARNIKKENIGNPLRELSDSIIAKVIDSGRPIIVSDALNDTIFGGSKSIINLKLSSVLSAPLKSGSNLIGLIYLGNNNVSHLFEHESLEILTIFAALTSLIVQNAFLLNQLDVEVKDKFNMKYGSIIGSSTKMKEVYDKIEKVAKTDISILITGETGTGKELVAKEIHAHSDRKDKPFIVVNCAAIPENLMESEFFGHKKGSFTGATSDSKGKFISANTGTIFLDEIGEMPLNLQAKLLRVLQEKIVIPVGDTTEHYIDVRVVAATNKNLQEEVKKGNFREDLLYRLNVIQIEIPQLSQREDDIEILSKFFLKNFSDKYKKKVIGFTPRSLELMKKYQWPGNVRELENKVKKAVVLADKIHITPDLLGIKDHEKDKIMPLSIAKQEFQREYIMTALKRNNDNKAKTARELEIDVRTIFRYLE